MGFAKPPFELMRNSPVCASRAGVQHMSLACVFARVRGALRALKRQWPHAVCGLDCVFDTIIYIAFSALYTWARGRFGKRFS